LNFALRASVAAALLEGAACLALAASPIAFEENRGQAAAGIAFLAQAGASRVFLARDGSVTGVSGRDAVRIELAGARPAAPVGLHGVAAKSNYLIGADPARWRTGIPNYGEVRYAHAYPKIDVIWHGHDGRMEHDFVVAPGGDPRRILLAIRGAAAEITPEGDLAAGDIRLRQPRAYQDGREIACRYERRGKRVGFALGEYDRARPLTIDPVLSFSTYLGGSGSDAAYSVALDGAGNIYVAGVTASANFPVTGGAFQQTYTGLPCAVHGAPTLPGNNIFVSKFTNDGNTLLFSTYLGRRGSTGLSGMATDHAGNVYLTGSAGCPDSSAPFVAKLSSDGSSLLYLSQLPVSSIAGLAVDGAGAVYLTGSSFGGIPVVNAFQSSVSKPKVFKTTDSAVHWQGLTNGLPSDLAASVTVDPSNPQTLYFGTWTGLYKTTDGGAHWAAILTGAPPQAPVPFDELDATWVTVDPVHSRTVYLGTLMYGIYKSTDGGATWSPAGAGAGTSVYMIAIDPVNTATLYAATATGLYKSTDGAATWNPTGLMAVPNNGYFVTSVVIIDPSTPTTIYAGTSNGVMKSLDGGVTWNAMTNGFSQSTNVKTLAIDPVNPQMLYAATYWNLIPYRTTDGGAHWTQGQWPTADPFEAVNWLLVDPLVHTTIWAVSDRRLIVSRDAGATWSAAPSELPDYGVHRLAGGSDGAIYAMASNSGTDAFAMKLDPSGTKIVYSTYLGGSGTDTATGIAVDGSGRAYVTGTTTSFDFPVLNAMQPRAAGLHDGFVSVLDPSGAHLVWSTYLGGSGDDAVSAIALDPAGNVHLTGYTSSGDFPIRQASQPSLLGGRMPFAAKVKGDGSGLIFSTYFGGSGGDSSYAVAADAAGNTYITGRTLSTDMPTLNAIQPGMAGSSDAFVASWNGQTGALQYSTYLGSGYSLEYGIAADAAGNAYVAGSTYSPDFPRKYAFQYNAGGGGDAFLVKISPLAAGPAMALSGVASAASYATVVAPGEIVSIFGAALAVTPATAGAPPLPVKLSDVTVSVNGVAAPLLYVSPVQINAQIPFETSPGTAKVTVSSSAGTAALNVQVAAAAPAIFTLNATGSGAGAIEHGLTGQLVTAANPAAAGEIVSVYCTGLGAVSPPAVTGAAPSTPPQQTVAPVQVYVAGAPARVSYAGLAPGFAGLYQVNVQIPAGTPSGVQSLQLVAGGASSNAVTIGIR
jgi:uncharacterized protein (TIGR03437 family)